MKSSARCNTLYDEEELGLKFWSSKTDRLYQSWLKSFLDPTKKRPLLEETTAIQRNDRADVLSTQNLAIRAPRVVVTDPLTDQLCTITFSHFDELKSTSDRTLQSRSNRSRWIIHLHRLDFFHPSLHSLPTEKISRPIV